MNTESDSAMPVIPSVHYNPRVHGYSALTFGSHLVISLPQRLTGGHRALCATPCNIQHATFKNLGVSGVGGHKRGPLVRLLPRSPFPFLRPSPQMKLLPHAHRSCGPAPVLCTVNSLVSPLPPLPRPFCSRQDARRSRVLL